MSAPRIVLIAYWVGAIVDAIATVQLLLPRSVRLLAFTGLRPDDAGAQPAVIAAALMIGWTLLLLWAVAHPLDRRAVLLLTLVVVALLFLGNVAVGFARLVPWSSVAPMLAVQAALAALFGVAWAVAERAAAPAA